MKVEISEDQNTLTVDGVEYEAKLNDAWPYKPSCKSCAFLGDGFFCKIAMETPLGVNASDLRRCEYPYRNDGKSIFWVKKEVEQMTEAPMPFPALAPAPFLMPAPAPVPHVHAEIITKWVKNINQPVFAFFEGEWTELGFSNPSWDEDLVYALGDKPTSPPMKKLKVKIKLDRNEFEIEVPYDARPQEVDKAILDMAAQFMVVTQEVI